MSARAPSPARAFGGGSWRRKAPSAAASPAATAPPTPLKVPSPKKRAPSPVKPSGGSGNKPAAGQVRPSYEHSEAALNARSDDLTAKMRAWAHQMDDKYKDQDGGGPVATVTVTVHALTGMELAEPFWMAAVSGSVDETGTATPLAEGTASSWPPRGAPSWSSEPLKLPVHDLSADLLLLLCESEGTEAPKACVGRVVVPLTEVLPANPFGGRPRPIKVWADIFPPAPQYAGGQVATTLDAALPSVVGSGMAVATAGQQGRALVSVALELGEGQSVLSSYVSVPPFDALQEPEQSARHERPPLAPERVQILAARLQAFTDAGPVPACVRHAQTTSPWGFGLVLLAMAYWAAYHLYLSTVPWWCLALYVVNGVAVRMVGHAHTEPWEPSRPPARSDAAQAELPAVVNAQGLGNVGLSAEERLRKLEGALRPLLASLEGLVSAAERLAAMPTAGDARATLLAFVPLVCATMACAAALYVVSACVLIAGGPQNFVFEVAAGLFVWNLASYHQREIRSCTGDDDGDEDSQRAAAAKNPFAPVTAHMRESAAQRSLEMAEDGEWLDSERRTAISGTVSSIWQNIFLRVPDAPTQVHRAIARAALTDADDSRGGHCLPCL